jgi:antigen flippase
MLKIIFQSLSTSVLSMIITFISSIIIARALGPEFRGEWASISLFVALISEITLIGFGDSYLYHKRKNYKVYNVSSVIIYSISIGFILNVIFFYFFKEYIKDEYAVLTFTMLILSGLVGLLSSICRVDSDLLVFNKSKVLFASTYTIFIILALSFYHLDLNIIMGISIFCLIIKFIYTASFSTVKQFSGVALKDKFDWYSYLKFGFKIHMTSVLGMLINNFDKIYLFFNARSFDFGIYAVAYGFSRLIGILPNTLSGVLYAKFAGEDESKASAMTSLIFSFLFIPLLFCSFILSVLSYYFVPILYGDGYVKAVIPIGILLFECVISGLGWILAQRFNAAGKPGLVFIRQLISIIPLIILIFYIPDYEITIVLSLAMLLASVIRLVVTLYMYKNLLNEELPRYYPTFHQINQLYSRFKIK